MPDKVPDSAGHYATLNPFPPRSAENPEPITGWAISRTRLDAHSEDWVLELSNGEHFLLHKHHNPAALADTLGLING